MARTAPEAPVPPEAARRGRPPKVDRDLIVEAAAALGPAGLTAAAVAARLGVSEAAVRYHFGAAELHRCACDRLFSAVDLVAEEASTWRDWLLVVAERLATLRQASPGLESYVLHGPFEPATLETFDAIMDQIARREPGMTRSTAYLLGASVVIAMMSDPGLSEAAPTGDGRVARRVQTVTRWRLETLIEGMAARVGRGDVPQPLPVPDDPYFAGARRAER